VRASGKSDALQMLRLNRRYSPQMEKDLLSGQKLSLEGSSSALQLSVLITNATAGLQPIR
jgi:hypothetical protein